MREGIVTLDLHGKTVYQARVAIDAALRRSRGVYILRIVHGYRSGSAIADMIAGEYAAHPAVRELRRGENPGVTELVLRAL